MLAASDFVIVTVQGVIGGAGGAYRSGDDVNQAWCTAQAVLEQIGTTVNLSTGGASF